MSSSPTAGVFSVATPRKRGLLGRLGCGVALVFWFVLLLAPCGLLLVAVNGEITIPTGSLPEQETRVWLIMEVDERGIGISTSGVHGASETRACVQTDTRFLLWQGRSDPLSYCQCYTRDDVQDTTWAYNGTTEGVCASRSAAVPSSAPASIAHVSTR